MSGWLLIIFLLLLGGLLSAFGDLLGTKIGKAIDDRQFAKRVNDLPQIYSNWTGTQEEPQRSAKPVRWHRSGRLANT